MTEKYKVTGMTCAACSQRVERAVGDLPGVTECCVNLLTGDMTVVGDVPRGTVCDAVVRAGYGVRGGNSERDSEEGVTAEGRVLRARLISSLLIVALLMYISMGHMAGLILPSFLETNPLANAILQMLLAALVMVINKQFFINGAKGLVRRSPNMDTLVSMGSLVSFLYSVYVLFTMTSDALSGSHSLEHSLHGLYFESAAMILALITLGKMLEARAKGKTTSAVRSLIDMAPKTARVIRDGKEYEIPVSEIIVGDVLAVKPGERIPIDGEVIFGVSAVDESMLTGESVPVEKSVGSRVYASCMNKSGYLRCRATVSSADTVLAGIIRMVEDATATKAPIAKLADRVSGVFVPVVIGLASITFILQMIVQGDVGFATARAIAVLVISCPCALGLATPVAIMVGAGVGAKHGILYKNAAALEECGRIDTVVLDKTGTVTRAMMSVLLVHAFADKERLISLACSIEKNSEHPIAEAITAYGEKNGAKGIDISDFSTIEGRGVFGRADGRELYGVSLDYAAGICDISDGIRDICRREAELGRTPVLFIFGGECIGVISVADTVDDGAKEGVRLLKKRGYRVVMLTGDNEITARAVASEVGISEVVSGVLPSGKESTVRELMKRGRVCMVGDGINDAPALTRANVGMAVGRGTDIAIDSADVVLINGGVKEALDALDIGRATFRNIKQNLLWAFLYNCIGIPLAAGVFGFSMPPMFGALAMSLSSVSVVLNALRLNLWRSPIERAISPAIDPLELKERENEEMTKEFNVKGMMCPHCEARVKSVVEAVEGVSLAVPSHTEKKVTVTFSGALDEAGVIKAITDAGYTVE